jgi:hypothetical protein
MGGPECEYMCKLKLRDCNACKSVSSSAPFFSDPALAQIAINQMAGPDVEDKVDQFITTAVDWFLDESQRANSVEHVASAVAVGCSLLSNAPAVKLMPSAAFLLLNLCRGCHLLGRCGGLAR